jgi:hypothetical protein
MSAKSPLKSANVRSPLALSPRQVKALAALMTASTIEAAAKAAGCSERQLRRWMDDPVFVAALDAAQRQAIDAALRRLTSLSVAAGAVLAQVMADTSAPSASRIRAADIVYGRMITLRDLTVLEQRLAALEQAARTGENRA